MASQLDINKLVKFAFTDITDFTDWPHRLGR